MSIFIFVEARDDLMSHNQAISFHIGRNTHRERVWMLNTRKVLNSASWNSPVSLKSERGSSRFNAPYGCSGLNMVWMTNKDAFLARSTQHSSSMAMVMMLSTNPSIETSFA